MLTLKSLFPYGVFAATGLPCGPAPVKDALRVGATVSVAVYALSSVAIGLSDAFARFRGGY